MARICSATALLCAAVLQTYGQTGLSLSDAISRALEHNQALGITRNGIDAARGQERQAGLRPNPRLYLQSEDYRWWGSPSLPYWRSTENYAYLAQRIESAGKRDKRIALAETGVAASALQDELLRQRIRAQVGNAYWTAAGAVKVRDLYREYLAIFDEDLTYISNRVREGMAPAIDAIRIRVERDRMNVQAITSASEADTALVDLHRSMGEETFPPTELTDVLTTSPVVKSVEPTQAIASRPEGKLALENVRRAEANMRLQQANAKPDPEVLGGYKHNLVDDTIFLGLQIDLPFRDRNQGNIGAAEAEIRAAQANLKATEANIKADLAAAEKAYAAQQQIAAGLPGTHGQAEEAARLARAAFREGGIDLLRLLDAERSRIDFEVQYWRSLIALKQSAVALQVASGEEVTP